MRPASLNQPKEHITSTPGVCGGKPCIAGSRIRVWDIAFRAQRGESPDDILSAFPHLTLADVYAALAYYYDHREDIENAAAEDEKLAEDLHQKLGPGPLEEKLRLVSSAPKSPPGE